MRRDAYESIVQNSSEGVQVSGFNAIRHILYLSLHEELWMEQ